jgi:hypothetical protein
MTALRMRPIRRPICWAASIASTAFRAASSRSELSRHLWLYHRLRRDEDRTMTPKHRSIAIAPCAGGRAVGLSVALGACKHTDAPRSRDGERSRRLSPASSDRDSGSRPLDRHFRRQARGGLSASQRADVMGLAQTWLREGTGAISADVPVDTPNARAAADSFREIRRCCGRRRAAARHCRAPLSSGRSAPRWRRSG